MGFVTLKLIVKATEFDKNIHSGYITTILKIHLAPTMTTIMTRARAKLARLAVTMALAQSSSACS